MSDNEDEPVTAGSMLASILKEEGKYTEEDLTRQMMEQSPHMTSISNGTITGRRDENGEIVIEDLSVQKTETIQ